MLKILNSRATNAQHRNGAAVRSSPLDRRRHYRGSEEDWAVNGGRGHGEAVNGRDDPTEAIRAMEAELEERRRIEALLNVELQPFGVDQGFWGVRAGPHGTSIVQRFRLREKGKTHRLFRVNKWKDVYVIGNSFRPGTRVSDIGFSRQRASPL